MTIIKVKDYARLIEEFDDTIRIKCFTDELNNNCDEEDIKEEVEIPSPSFIRCNCSSVYF